MPNSPPSQKKKEKFCPFLSFVSLSPCLSLCLCLCLSCSSYLSCGGEGFGWHSCRSLPTGRMAETGQTFARLRCCDGVENLLSLRHRQSGSKVRFHHTNRETELWTSLKYILQSLQWCQSGTNFFSSKFMNFCNIVGRERLLRFFFDWFLTTSLPGLVSPPLLA